MNTLEERIKQIIKDAPEKAICIDGHPDCVDHFESVIDYQQIIQEVRKHDLADMKIDVYTDDADIDVIRWIDVRAVLGEK